MRAAVIGESLIDLVWTNDTGHIEPKPGGSPANVAFALHRLGRPITLITCWGDDPAGDMIQKYLVETELDVCRVKSISGRTMAALAYVNSDSGDATYQFLSAWDPLDLPLDHEVTLLHTGSLAGVLEPGATRVLDACWRMRTRPGAAVSVDLNVRPAALPDRDAYRDAATRLALLADVIKASDEDLQWLFPDESPLSAARALLELGPQLVVVTHGPRGASALTVQHEVHVEAPRVQVVDTIGAGDAFQATLLDTLMGPGPETWVRIPSAFTALQEMLRRCTAAGTAACSQAGAYPPTRQEIGSARRSLEGA